MVHVLHAILLWTIRVSGIVLVYAALFLKESEEGQVQNRLEGWLKMIQSRRDVSRSLSVRIINAAAASSEKVFTVLFGERLFAIQSLLTSISLSLTSVWIFNEVNTILDPSANRTMWWDVQNVLLVIGFAFLTLLPLVTANRKIITIRAVIIVAAVLIGAGWYTSDQGNLTTIDRLNWVLIIIFDYLIVLSAFALSCVCDLSFVALTRYLLRKTSNLSRSYEAVLFLLPNFAIGCALTLLAINQASDQPMSLSSLGWFEDEVLPLFASFNLIDGMAASVVVIFLAAIVFHRLFWPTLERPLYSLNRFGVIRNKKFLWAIGLACVIGPVQGQSIAQWIIQQISKSS